MADAGLPCGLDGGDEGGVHGLGVGGEACVVAVGVADVL